MSAPTSRFLCIREFASSKLLKIYVTFDCDDNRKYNELGTAKYSDSRILGSCTDLEPAQQVLQIFGVSSYKSSCHSSRRVADRGGSGFSYW